MLEYLCLAGGLYCTAFGVACVHLTRRRGRKLTEAEASLERRWAAFRAADHSVEVNLAEAVVKLAGVAALFRDIEAKHRQLTGEIKEYAQIHAANLRLGRQIDGFLDDFAPVLTALTAGDDSPDAGDDAPKIKPVILPFGQDTPSRV